MAKENRMSREEYKAECEKVQDTAYAEKGHPQSFGNELLLQNIDAFGTEIAVWYLRQASQCARSARRGAASPRPTCTVYTTPTALPPP